MENSFKFNDITASNISPVSDEERIEESDDLSDQFDQVTGSQMKEIEVKKIEDEIIIKRLEKEYRDKQKGLSYSTKKLREYRLQRSNSTELMKKYDLASKAFVEKANELKRFHNEVILVNVDNAERKSAEDKKKIADLQMTFQAVTMRDNHSKCLNEKLEYKASEINSNIARQIDQREEEYNKRLEKLTKSRSRIEALKKELNQQTINSNLKDVLEKKGKRFIELEAEIEKLQKQLKQELDAVMEDKNKLIQEKTNSKKSIQENDKLSLTLLSEISVSEKNKSDLSKNLEQLRTEKEKLFIQVAKERENVELSKNSLIERGADIESELSKMKEKKESLITNFTISEENMHTELKKLYNELNFKKSLSQKIDNYEQIRRKLNEKKTSITKMFSNLGLEDKLNKTKDDLKKHEERLLNFNKKKNNSELKIKELEQKKIQESKKLESSTKTNEETLGVSSQFNTPKNEATAKKVQGLSKSPDIPSIFSYKLSDSDESEDEFKIKDIEPKNSQKFVYTPLTQKKSTIQSEEKEQNSSNTPARSSEEELFNKLCNNSSPDQTDAKTNDTMDVFKLPKPVMQYKKKTPQQKKKN